jgi:hypothetical protein
VAEPEIFLAALQTATVAVTLEGRFHLLAVNGYGRQAPAALAPETLMNSPTLDDSFAVVFLGIGGAIIVLALVWYYWRHVQEWWWRLERKRRKER